VDEDADTLRIAGVGLRGLRPSNGPVDCGNAGTLMRLLPGILAGQRGRFELTGDESLRRRPVDRVADPLTRMGARIETSGGRPPLVIEGAPLRGIRYELPVASAQVKSCLLLAGLLARGDTRVREPTPTRDHTERMLRAAGADVRRRGHDVTVKPAERLTLPHVDVPGDFSSAAPFVVGATLLAGSSLTIHGVGINSTRTGLLDALDRMGARVTVLNRRQLGGEPVGDLDVRSAPLTATTIDAEDVPRLVDELPLFALVAGGARGESVVRGAAELRLKESDRINTVTTALRAIGVRITATSDGFRVRGVPTRPRGGSIDSAGDHRIAMLGAIAGVVSKEGVRVEGADSAAISFPGFFELLESVAQR
jgi:3-phosphoshikimate 1-carboxyvinyltransferase